MNEGSVLGKGMSFPPRIGRDGRMVWSHGSQNIREAIQVILMTEQEERLRLPEFGGNLKRFLFEPNTVTTRHLIEDRITKALAAWEPRIQVQSVAVDPDPVDSQAAVATVAYKLVATRAQEELSMRVSLTGR